VSAKLARADLTGAELTMANLDGAELAGARLGEASFYRTLLTGCTDLERAVGLGDARHYGPSVLDLATLRAGAFLPLAFLEGAGLAADFVEALRPLLAEL
jgi:uncharacterized protein YjbI with pentapeptide repeats